MGSEGSLSLCVHQLFTAQEMQSVGEFKQGGRSDSKVRTSHSCVCEEKVCQLQSRLQVDLLCQELLKFY